MKIEYEKLRERFLKIVTIEGVSLNERQIADAVRRHLVSLQIEVTEDDSAEKINGNCGNLIARKPGVTGLPPLLLMAHLDTVESTARLHPVIENGIIKSDGTTILGGDNRAGVAIILYVLETLINSKMAHRSLEIVFSVGEELGMYGASQLDFSKLAAKEGYVLDCSCSPGGFVAQTPTALDFNIHFLGRSAHSGVHPEEGINALNMAVEVLNNFPTGRIDAKTVANVGVIKGGTAINIVPDQVSITGEIRSFSSQSIQKLRENLEDDFTRVCQKYGGRIERRFNTGFEGFRLDHQPVIQRMEAEMIKMGLHPVPLTYFGGSDANVLNQRGITTVNLGIGVKNPHSHQEQIALDDLAKMAELILRIIKVES